MSNVYNLKNKGRTKAKRAAYGSNLNSLLDTVSRARGGRTRSELIDRSHLSAKAIDNGIQVLLRSGEIKVGYFRSGRRSGQGSAVYQTA
jgi:hypothetical protein